MTISAYLRDAVKPLPLLIYTVSRNNGYIGEKHRLSELLDDALPGSYSPKNTNFVNLVHVLVTKNLFKCQNDLDSISEVIHQVTLAEKSDLFTQTKITNNVESLKGAF